jgi:RNA polymerase sigma-70 factor (ECF subfamily)
VIDQEVSSFRSGDEKALRALYDSHGSLIYTYCVRTVGANGAADVTQEVFISAWRSRENFDPDKGTFAGWLMTIAKRRCVDALRRTGRRPEFATDIGSEANPALALAASDVNGGLSSADLVSTERIADRMLLDDAIARLPPRARRAVELAFYEQLTHPEIAATTGTPLGTVKSDIRRALIEMRKQLGGGNV